ncbi:MAG: hypothetical protein FJY77_04715 [Candidatus Altiarchaeales archaeon]|nr:hypothetical protein [Candidatus Altiarchaeales archaeon]
MTKQKPKVVSNSDELAKPDDKVPQTKFVDLIESITLGETEIYLRRAGNRGDKRLYVRLHCDENTAAEAALSFVREEGGEALIVEAQQYRAVNFEFTYGGEKRKYYFDANRIFTPAGRDATLSIARRKNPQTGVDEALAWRLGEKEAVMLILTGFTKTLLNAMDLDSRELVVAVHNNRTYTLDEAAKTAKPGFVHKNPGRSLNDFFLVTQESDFAQLKAMGFNVVMQDNKNVKDDGSLSVFCKNKRYINIEAAHDHSKQQLEMLQALQELK